MLNVLSSDVRSRRMDYTASTKLLGLQINDANATSELTEGPVGECEKIHLPKIRQNMIMTLLFFSQIEENLARQIR